MKKRVLSVLLCAVMLCGLLPTPTAWAALSYSVYVGGVDMYVNDSTVTYYKNGDTTELTGSAEDYNAKLEKVYGAFKLTIKNLSVEGTDGVNNGAGIYVSRNYLYLELEGVNSVTGGNNTGDDSYGIYTWEGLIIQGDGVLNVTGGTAEGTDSVSCGIYSETVDIQEGTINATGGTAAHKSYGIYTNTGTNIDEGATINATGGTAGNVSCGIGASRVVGINGGTVVATGGTAGSEADSVSFGIDAEQQVHISNGVVVARAGSGTTAKAINGPLITQRTKIAGQTTGGSTLSTNYSTLDEAATDVVIVPSSYEGKTKAELASDTITLDGDVYVVSADASAVELTDDTTIDTDGHTLVAVSLFSGNGNTAGIDGGESLTISGSGKVIAVGGASTGSRSYGISAGVAVSGTATVTAVGGNANLSCGVESVEISGGTLNAVGGKAASGSYGVNGGVDCSGGTLNAIGGTAASGSYGVNGGVDYSGGTLNAYGQTYGLNGTAYSFLKGGNYTGGTAAIHSDSGVNSLLAYGYGYYDGETPIEVENSDKTVGSAHRTVTVKKLPTVAVTSVSLSQSELTLTLDPEDTVTGQLKATVIPDKVDIEAIEWKSSDESVAKVTGISFSPVGGGIHFTVTVTAVGAGEATITVTANDGSDLSESCTVTVNKQSGPPAPSSSDFAVTPPSSSSASDGKISGVDDTMEYSTDRADWTPCSGTEITDLSSGTYYIRYKGTDTVAASSWTTVKIDAVYDITLVPNNGDENLTIPGIAYGGNANDRYNELYGSTDLDAGEALGANIAKEGYIFAGWYTEPDGGNEYAFDTEVIENTTLYAKWADVVVAGKFLSDGDTFYKNGDKYAHYANGVLTLHNFATSEAGYCYYIDEDGNKYTASIYVTKDITIKIEGTETCTLQNRNHSDGDAFGEDEYGNGIVTADGADVTIVGDGILDIETADYGIHAKGDVTINGVEVDIEAQDNDGIYADGDVTISGGTVYVEARDYDYDGIYAEGDVTISGGTVNVTAGEDGIDAEGDVTISGGTVDIEAQDNDGIDAGGDVTIGGGTVDIDAEAFGIHAEGDVTISGGEVDVTAGDRDGIYSIGSIKVIGGTVNAKTTDTTGTYYALCAHDGLTLGEEVTIVEPANGKVATFTDIQGNDYYTIVDDTDVPALAVRLEPPFGGGGDGPVGPLPTPDDQPYIPPYTPPYIRPYNPSVLTPNTDPSDCAKGDDCMISTFEDSDPSEWYHDGVHFAVANGLMIGTSETEFEPLAPMTRAMVVTILWRLEGEPVVDYLMQFEDVPQDAWYAEAVRWAASVGIVEGHGDGTFDPNGDVTREQLATMLYRYEQLNGGGFVGMWMFRMDFIDLADVSEWAYEPLCWMVMNGVIEGKPSGDGMLLDPKGNALRAEVATMLMRYLGLEK